MVLIFLFLVTTVLYRDRGRTLYFLSIWGVYYSTTAVITVGAVFYPTDHVLSLFAINFDSGETTFRV